MFRSAAKSLRLYSACLATALPAAVGAQQPHTLSSVLAAPGTPQKVAKQGPGVFAEGVAADWSGNIFSIPSTSIPPAPAPTSTT